MKGIYLTIVLLFATVSCALAEAPKTFSWDANTDNPAYYRILWGQTAGGPYDAGINVGLPLPDAEGRCQFTIDNPPPKLNCYVAVACDEDNFCSPYSNEVCTRSFKNVPNNVKEEK